MSKKGCVIVSVDAYCKVIVFMKFYANFKGNIFENEIVKRILIRIRNFG